MNFHQHSTLLILFSLFWRTFFRPWNSDAALFRDDANRFRKCALFHLHHEFENVAAHTATKTVINLLRRVHGKRRRLLRVKRAQPRKIRAALLQTHVFADNPHNVGLLFDSVRE